MAGMVRKRVVAPIDFSDASFQALSVAAELVEDPTHLHLVFILPELHPAEPGVLWDRVDDDSRIRHADAELGEKLKGTPFEAAPRHIAVGDPGSEIVGYAEQIEADMVVLPSHGRTGVQRFFMGSVAERVARLAPCPVLVLRRND